MEKVSAHSKSDIEVFFERLSKGPVQYKVVLPVEQKIPPANFDFSGLETASKHDSENIQRVVRELYDRCVTFIHRPMLVDTIADHKERREWQIRITKDPEIAKIFTPFQQSNKLRFNNISHLTEMQYALRLYLSSKAANVRWGKKNYLLQLLAEEFPSMKDYSSIDLDAKLQRVAQLDQFCIKYIRIFSSPSI